MTMTIRQTREFAREQRISAIMRMHREGQTMSAIGRAFDLSKARIQQIIRDVEREGRDRHLPQEEDFSALPQRVQLALAAFGIFTVDQLAGMTDAEIKLLPGVGSAGRERIAVLLRGRLGPIQ